MKRLLDAYFMCWGMFLSLPCPRPVWNEEYRPLMLFFLPIIGGMIGGIWSVLSLALRLIPSGLFSAVVLAVLPWLLTGFIHLDGFMDVCDAVLSSRNQERRLQILKDPHCGAFAVICMILLALLQVSDPATRWPAAHSLLLIPIVSRIIVALLVLNRKALPGSQYSNLHSSSALSLALLGLTVLLLVCFPAARLSVLATLLATLASAQYGYRNLGGMSGDISGFSLTLGELFGLILACLGGAL